MRQINLVEGKVVAPEGMKVGIVAARFNEIIVNKLLGGAVDGLVRHGVEEENITAAWVPGAFEIPLTAQKMAQSGKYDAVISLNLAATIPTFIPCGATTFPSTKLICLMIFPPVIVNLIFFYKLIALKICPIFSCFVLIYFRSYFCGGISSGTLS